MVEKQAMEDKDPGLEREEYFSISDDKEDQCK